MPETLILTSFTIYRPDGLEDRDSIAWPKCPGLDLLRSFIEPIIDGPLEHVTVLKPGLETKEEIDPISDRRDMFVDEIGHMKLKPLNVTATKIYRVNWLRMFPKSDPDALPWICGTAILFDRIVWF